MIILKSGEYLDAVTIIEKEGYRDITPDVGLTTHKLFEKDGKLFVFNGWNRLDEKRRWNDVELIEVKIRPADPKDLEFWKTNW